jgi:hypothetical protein
MRSLSQNCVMTASYARKTEKKPAQLRARTVMLLSRVDGDAGIRAEEGVQRGKWAR